MAVSNNPFSAKLTQLKNTSYCYSYEYMTAKYSYQHVCQFAHFYNHMSKFAVPVTYGRRG